MSGETVQNEIKPDPDMAAAFLRHLFGGQSQGFLTITSFPGAKTKFFDLSKARALEQAAIHGCALAACGRDVYFGVGLLKKRLSSGRGKQKDVMGIPGGWADVDYLHSAHAATNLPPTPDDALWVADALGRKYSVLVHSGHGWQAYWLFDRIWSLDDDQSRTDARQFSDALQSRLRTAAESRRWSLDNTSDLARILRLPGSINYKDRAAPCLITFEIAGPRYGHRDLVTFIDNKPLGRIGIVGSDGFVADSPFPEQLPEVGTVGSEGFVAGSPYPGDANGRELQEDEYRGELNPEAGAGTASIETLPDSGESGEKFPPAEINPIVQGCAWMRHCRNDAKTLPEPEWHALLTILGHCKDGAVLAHTWSRPYPKYSEKETRLKLNHALKDSGPITCQYISEKLGQSQLCGVCPNQGAVRSPIILGDIRRRSLADKNWSKPKPLSAALPDVVPFDSKMLPRSLREFVVDVAERLQIPADFPAATLLVALAGAIGRRATITPMRHDKSFIVVPNLWGGIVGRPGLMKSPCIQIVMAPLRRLQSLAMQQYKTDLEHYERELEAWEARKACWKKKASRDSNANGFEEPKPEKPAGLRFIVNDTTVEKPSVNTQNRPCMIT